MDSSQIQHVDVKVLFVLLCRTLCQRIILDSFLFIKCLDETVTCSTVQTNLATRIVLYDPDLPVLRAGLTQIQLYAFYAESRKVGCRFVKAIFVYKDDPAISDEILFLDWLRHVDGHVARDLTDFLFNIIFEDGGRNRFNEVGQVIDVDAKKWRSLNIDGVFDDHIDKVVRLLFCVLPVTDCRKSLSYSVNYGFFDCEIQILVISCFVIFKEFVGSCLDDD